MRGSWTPSIVPVEDDQNVYIVVHHFGRNGRAYRQTEVEAADLEITIADLMAGQCSNPPGSSFNTAERWSEDVPMTLPMKFDADAICRRPMSLRQSEIL